MSEEFELEKLRHNNKMLELEKEEELARKKYEWEEKLVLLKHEKDLERQRIENAERRKLEEAKFYHITEARRLNKRDDKEKKGFD